MRNCPVYDGAEMWAPKYVLYRKSLSKWIKALMNMYPNWMLEGYLGELSSITIG